MNIRLKCATALASLCLLSLTSCGEQHRAEALVEDFLEENTIGDRCKVERCTRLARTAMVTEKTVAGLRHEMSLLPTFRKDIKYSDKGLTDTLVYVRATYKLSSSKGKETEYVQTFYMDKALSGIVAFKEN